MNSKHNYELSLDFKIPKDMPEEKLERKSLPWEQYAEFVRIGLELMPDINKERQSRIKNAPEIKFVFK